MMDYIRIDYIRWVFRVDFCTPSYIIRSELGMKREEWKLKIGWSIRARRYEEKIKDMEAF